LAVSDLAHFYPDTKGLGHVLDELTEIDTFLCRIVKCGLGAIALKLHIGDFHLQVEQYGDFAGSFFYFLFPIPTFLPNIDILLGCLSVYFRKIGVFKIFLFSFHLDPYQLSRKRYHANVVSRLCLCGNNIPYGKGKISIVSKKFLSTILKPDFHTVKSFFPIGQRHIGKPIKNRQFITTIGATSTIVLATPRLSSLTGRTTATTHIQYI